MVKKLIIFFLYSAVFVLSLIVFIPKSNLYYLGEETAKKYNVIISKEQLIPSSLNLTIKNADVSIKSIKALKIKETDVVLLLLFNRITLHDINIMPLIQSYMPNHIQNIMLQYSVLNPFHISGNSQGDFGSMSADVDILKRTLTVTLKTSKEMQKNYHNSLKFFKKSKNGDYSYAKTFK